MQQSRLVRTLMFFREPNPILVRELKQFVRNRLLLYFMLFYLGFISLATIAVLVLPEFIGEVNVLFFSFSEYDGQELFAFLMMSYYVFSSAFLVLFGSIKLGYERYKNDLGYYTTVASWRIISGKFLLGVIVSLIFLSILMPFLTIAYMMRGLDVLTIVLAVLFYFFMSLVHYSVTITFFAGARTLTRIYLFGLILAFLQFVGFYIGLAASFVFIFYPEFLGSQLYYVMIPYLIQWAFIFFPLPFAICQVSPESSNRMMPVRICMTLFFLFVVTVFTGTLFYEISSTATPDYIEALGIVSMVAMVCIYIFYPIFFLIFICEREKYSIRQRRLVPRNRALRLLYFLHATGVSNAIAWYFLFIIVNVGIFLFWYILASCHIDGSYNSWNEAVKEIFWRFIPFGMMVFCWAILCEAQLKRFLPREWLSFPLLCFGVIVFIFCIVCMEAMPYSSRESLGMMFSVFPIVMFEEMGTKLQYFFGIVGTAIFITISAEKILDAFESLSRYEGAKVLTEAELQEAVRQATRETPAKPITDDELIASEFVAPEIVAPENNPAEHQA